MKHSVNVFILIATAALFSACSGSDGASPETLTDPELATPGPEPEPGPVTDPRPPLAVYLSSDQNWTSYDWTGDIWVYPADDETGVDRYYLYWGGNASAGCQLASGDDFGDYFATVESQTVNPVHWVADNGRYELPDQAASMTYNAKSVLAWGYNATTDTWSETCVRHELEAAPEPSPPLPDNHLTQIEKRNLEVVDDWESAWTLPGGSAERMVNEIYAETTEVFLPVGKELWVRWGESKESWLALEKDWENLYPMRWIIFHRKFARDNVVAMEIETRSVTHYGVNVTSRFAVFITFDDEGRIISDHTFMPSFPEDVGGDAPLPSDEISHATLTEVENRNLELVDAWAAAWRLPGGSAEERINEIYAQSTDVYLPLQERYIAKTGESKESWLEEQLDLEKDFLERRMVVHKKMARGDVVAVEIEVFYTLTDGTEDNAWIAAFLTFDDDGKISSDHSYMGEELLR
jgi:hypothetical protein